MLEQHTTGHVWAEHYEGLRLHTPKQVSQLPDRPMPEDLPLFPSGPQVRDYLAAYRHQFGLDVREGVQVHSASWSNGRWRLDTSEGELTTGSLVAATGIWSRPVYPDIPGLGDVSGTLVHSARYRSAEQLRGRRVLVVGAGNSGCEIAVGLVGVADAVHLSVHGEALFVPRPSSALFSRLSAPLLRRLPVRLASVLIDRVRPDLSDIGLPPPDLSASTYPVVGMELPDAVRQGRVEVVGALDRFEGDTAVFSDGASRSVDAVVLATGFRPALDWLDDSQYERSDGGAPIVDDQWRSRLNPTLSCVGFDYPTTEGWLQALGRVSRQAADGVEATIRAE